MSTHSKGVRELIYKLYYHSIDLNGDVDVTNLLDKEEATQAIESLLVEARLDEVNSIMFGLNLKHQNEWLQGRLTELKELTKEGEK